MATIESIIGIAKQELYKQSHEMPQGIYEILAAQMERCILQMAHLLWQPITLRNIFEMQLIIAEDHLTTDVLQHLWNAAGNPTLAAISKPNYEFAKGRIQSFINSTAAIHKESEKEKITRMLLKQLGFSDEFVAYFFEYPTTEAYYALHSEPLVVFRVT